jgi:hypothetical protein
MCVLRFHQRHLRHIAWVTLVFWLFALATGVVNACVPTPQAAASRAIDAVARSNAAQHEDHGHDGPIAHHGHQQDAGKTGCLKFCDDESSALSKNDASSVDLGATFVAVVQPWHSMVPITSVETRLSVARPTAQGPPLVIRFLRLAL